jgi:hypothetical protein
VSKAAIEVALHIAFEKGYKKGRNDAQEGVLIDPSVLSEYLIEDMIKTVLKDAPKVNITP